MNKEDRPNPDELLRQIDEEEKNSRIAKLRVFLGMSAGVGKTYAMLSVARQRLREGADVVIGVVETHGRSETESLLAGLPVIPRKKIDYRGTRLEEMDLDAILSRKPELVIVDELAHTNVPGSRHEKRYQDVLELLDAGIDVYTALNVQHLESRKDAVESITGTTIRETVPDSLLERASLVELVDIAPSELLKRLKEGKVYLGDKAERAAQNFFKEDRLTALREIALRMTAERVDQDLQRLAKFRQEAPWQTNERLMVAVSHSPSSEKLIRATRRLAYSMEAPWVALHIETGQSLSNEDQAQLTKNLNLARELKAEVITTTETDVPAAIRRIARQKNVTQLIVGRPARRRFRDMIEGGSLLDRLVRESQEVDVHVIRQDVVPSFRASLTQRLAPFRTRGGWLRYWNTLLFLFGISFVSGLVEPWIGYRTVGFIFLLAVLVVGVFSSLGPVVFAAALSALVWDYFFILPRMTLSIREPEDLILCVAFFVAALITGLLTHRIRLHERLIREREDRTNVLYEILQDISVSREKSEFLSKIVRRAGALFDAECGVVLRGDGGELDFKEYKPYSLTLSEKEQAVARWAFQAQKSAGWSTETLSQSAALYLPLRGQNESLGVFVLRPKKDRKLDIEQENLLHSILRQLGISLERHLLGKRLEEARHLKESEQLHQTLLNSISHEMRTPLTAILGSASALEEEKVSRDADAVKKIAVHLQEAGDRLNQVVENLLDMSRLSSGVLTLNLEWQDLNDLIGVTAGKVKKSLSRHRLKVQGLDGVSLVKIDFRLMEHAISNLLVNAAMYSPDGSEIEISLTKREGIYRIEVADEGKGVPQDSLQKIFEKFYRVPGSPTGGTGLGLSIVKSIVELHRGSVGVSPRSPHGSRFWIELPADKAPSMPDEEAV